MMNRLLTTSSRKGRAAIRSSMYRMMSSTSTRRPVVLCILDGWGYSETLSNNAVTLANTPNFDYVYGRCSQLGQAAFLNACEKEVGLPTGQIGNSEVGHMNIGAGRVVYQVRCMFMLLFVFCCFTGKLVRYGCIGIMCLFEQHQEKDYFLVSLCCCAYDKYVLLFY